jgi:hypothetical protein
LQVAPDGRVFGFDRRRHSKRPGSPRIVREVVNWSIGTFSPGASQIEQQRSVHCLSCGESYQTTEAGGKCRYCGFAALWPDGRDARYLRSRHGCATIYFAFIVIVNSGAALFYLAIAPTITGNLRAPLNGLMAVMVIVFAIALLAWKKWGFSGLLITSVVAVGAHLIKGPILSLDASWKKRGRD